MVSSDMGWFWLSLLARSGVILGAGEVLRRTARRLPAADRHKMIAAAFGLLLCWPLLATLLPEWRVPLASRNANRASVTVQQRVLDMKITSARRPAEHHWPLVIWLAGAGLALLPTLAGYVRAMRLQRSATPLESDSWKELLAQGCRDLNVSRMPRLLLSEHAVMPLVFGWRRPRILLPQSAIAWTATRQRAVVNHELAHIRRNDLATQLAANLATALWWFQPLSWVCRLSLRAESELACDAQVLACGLRPSDYAAELLAIAQAFHREHGVSAAVIGMSRRRDLETRLKAILESHPARSRRDVPVAALSALTLLALSASALTLAPAKTTPPKGVLTMRRTVMAGLLASAGLSAATIGGSIFDPSGAAIPDAKALLINPDTAAKMEATTTPEGKFNFESLPAGEYILRIEKPGFAALFREFDVQADSKVERGMTLELGPIEQQVNVAGTGTPRTTAAQSSHPGAVRIGGAVAQSNLVTRVQPVYPGAAKAAGVQGTVQLEAVISKEGVPLDVRVVSSPDDDLSQSSLEAVRQWRYRPTLLNGEPVEVVTEVIVNYTLSK